MRKMKGHGGIVQIEHHGRKYEGRYVVHGRLVTVFYGARRKSTQIGASGIVIARMLLRELVRERG